MLFMPVGCLFIPMSGNGAKVQTWPYLLIGMLSKINPKQTKQKVVVLGLM